MPFQLRHEQPPNTFGKDPTIWILDDGQGNRLDVWPALGFNASRWTAAGVDLLDRDPAMFEDLRPSRSGFPILFPFPNRIRAGRFSHAGQDFSLPLNCPVGKNTIHGFVLNETPSSVEVLKLGDDEAILQGRFEGKAVNKNNIPHWPADFTLLVAYHLGINSLTIRATVISHDQPLPMGLGYHPYFLMAPFGGDDALVTLAADRVWQLQDNLPTGERLDLETSQDLRVPRRFGDLKLDDVYTALRPTPTDESSDLGLIASVRDPHSSRRLDLLVSPAFRELVAFTPPHRRSLCLEPYTCTTDAINLQAQGIDAGWLELPPRQSWQAIVRQEFTP